MAPCFLSWNLKKFIYLFIYLNNDAQVNLVPNYSFESMTKPCDYVMAITSLNNFVTDWFIINTGTVEYCNRCSNLLNYPTASSVPLHCKGYQQPNTGDGFIGMCLYSTELNLTDTINVFAEYVSVKLVDTLKANHCYYGEMYVNLSNISLNTINQISMLCTQNTFTTSQLSFTNTIQPQIQWDTTQYLIDTLNWVKISGTFLAQGGEQYLTIGNFRDGAHLKRKNLNSNFSGMINGSCGNVAPLNVGYYNIDDIALYEIPTPKLQSNAITICPNADTLILGDTARIQTHYQWFANGTAIDTTSFIKVKPTQTTTYVLQSTNCTTTSQTIIVTYSANCIPPEPIVVVEPIIPNVFTPNNDSINDVWRFSLGKGNSLKGLSIYNRWGNEIAVNSRASVTQINWDGRTTSGEETPSGVYFFVLQYTDANGDEHKKNGYITLIK
jgi:gliding motility-associated-like protein